MKKILIIGAGVAGLSAGIYAQLNGFHAVVCESHSVVGGCLSSWKREGYHIDNCIHWLTGTNPHSDEYPVWEALGVLGNNDGDEIYIRNSLFTYCSGSQSVSLYRDIEKLRNELIKLSLNDKKEIDRYIDVIKAIQGLFGLAGENHDQRFGFVKSIVSVMKLLKYNSLSASELAERFESRIIKGFLISFLPDNFGALALAYVIANFCAGNGDLPMGGSELMAKRMTDRFTSLGGELILKKKAVKVNLNAGKADSVSFSDGTVMDADYFILTPDPAIVFNGMLDAEMPKRLMKYYINDQPRFSAYQCAFGCDIDKPLFEGDITIDIPPEYRKELNAEYMMIRCDSHESYAPKGKSLIQTMIYCSKDEAKSWVEQKNSDVSGYKRRKKLVGDITAEILFGYYPELCGKIKCIDVWTPATYKRYTGSQIGSFMSFAFTKKRLPLRIPGNIKELDNVFLAGQWLQMPGGLPIAAITGKCAVDSAVKHLNK